MVRTKGCREGGERNGGRRRGDGKGEEDENKECFCIGYVQNGLRGEPCARLARGRGFISALEILSLQSVWRAGNVITRKRR